MVDFSKRFDSAKQKWTTPNDLYEIINNEFHFEWDLAADKTNTKCDNFFDESINSLKQDWRGVCWLNPPYGDKKT